MILFDNAGVASSSGETPDTFEAQADHVARVFGGPLIGASSPIAAGAAAPAFALAGVPDRKIALSDFVGQTVILVFYPADWSPVCTDQLALYNELLPLFTEHRAQVLGISVDGVWSHRAFAKDRNLRFPLLSDFEPKGAVSRAYGVYSEQDGTSERALFVIDGALASCAGALFRPTG